MNILLLNNHSVLNAGDHAILLETLAVLDTVFPHARVTLAFNDVVTARAAHPRRLIVASPLAHVTRLTPDGESEMAPFDLRRTRAWQLLGAALAVRVRGTLPGGGARLPAFVRALAEADLVLACGGGYLYAPSAEGSFGWFDFTLLGCLMAVLMRKPLVLLPQSFGPLHGLRQKLPVALVARAAALVCARERVSLALLRSLGADKRALLAPDMAFGMNGATPADGEALLARAGLHALRPAYTVGVTALNWAGQNYTFSAQQQYEAALVAAIDTICEDGGAVALFAQCCGPAAAEDDRRVARRLHAAARWPERVTLLAEPLAPPLLQAAYGQVDFFIGTRMHSVILALNAGTPALAVGYLHKTRGMLHEVGLAHHALEIGSVSGNELVAALGRLREAPAQPEVPAYLERARRFKRALPALLQPLARPS
jgi:colanic acid/amylovoran biosynthesis protein